jgi:protein-export membrane protein SecD
LRSGKPIHPARSFLLGLDLQGGIQLVLQVETEKVSADSGSDLVDRVTEIVRSRIDEFSVREPMISRQGKNRVVVQLPGVTDRQRALSVVAKTAHLEFKLAAEGPEMESEGNLPEGYEHIKPADSASRESLLVGKTALLTGAHLKDASVGFDSYRHAMVHLEFDSRVDRAKASALKY